jgi:hypothetical protein
LHFLHGVLEPSLRENFQPVRLVARLSAMLIFPVNGSVPKSFLKRRICGSGRWTSNCTIFFGPKPGPGPGPQGRGRIHSMCPILPHSIYSTTFTFARFAWNSITSGRMMEVRPRIPSRLVALHPVMSKVVKGATPRAKLRRPCPEIPIPI